MPSDHQNSGIPALHTDREGRTRLALARNHPNRHRSLRVGQALDGGENESWDAPWRVDKIALAMPWRRDGLAATDGEKIAITRLAVLRAYEDARCAEARRRGRRETILNLRRGDPLLGGKRLPDILDDAWAKGAPPSSKIATLTNMAADRLGVELQGDAGDGARLRAAASGGQHQGRAKAVELSTFVRTLALWWFQNTAKRPEREINPIRRPKKRTATFVDFVLAASIDVSRSGHSEPEGIRSVIRRELERMEGSTKG